MPTRFMRMRPSRPMTNVVGSSPTPPNAEFFRATTIAHDAGDDASNPGVGGGECRFKLAVRFLGGLSRESVAVRVHISITFKPRNL